MITGAPFHIWQAVPIFIIIAGYVGALSYKRHQNSTLLQLYSIRLLSRRIKRIIVPFIVVFTIQIIYIYIYIYPDVGPIQITNIITSFISGGHGPGSYFVPLIIQHILILPILYVWIIKYPKYFIPLTFLISLTLEQLMILLSVPVDVYRLLYIRYFFAGALGVWLAINHKTPIKILILGALLSSIYIFVVNYLNYQPSFIYPAWSSQHSPSYLWTLLIIVAGISYFPEDATNLIQSLIKKLGQASWHIFLVQMTYFWILGSHVKSFFFSGLSYPISFDIQTLTEISLKVSTLSVLNLVICLYIGYIFHKKSLHSAT
ncbi:MAG: acetyltransferase, fucose-4-O-acetylase [Methanohalophilus sp.]|nr:MAG: acetyltransferase, fucose-4-O-acetylase [Methanohalophilus sp.]